METDLKILRQKAGIYLDRTHFSLDSIRAYNSSWDRLTVFMSENGYHEFNPDVSNAYIIHRFGTTDRRELKTRQKKECHHLDVLLDIQSEGLIRVSNIIRKTYSFDGPDSIAFNKYFDEISQIKAHRSVENEIAQLYMLYSFLQEHKFSLSTLKPSDLVEYVIYLDKRRPGKGHNGYVSTTRNFFKYLCGNSYLQNNTESLWLSLLKHRDTSHKTIPSTFTTEQVEKIIQSIDRTQRRGKRDYAMVLLASRYGMRSSDIVGLRFCNLDWGNNRISFVQQKTKKRVTLPLSEEVGSAIIDYIQYARPDVESPFVFMSATAPFRPIKSTSVGAHIEEWLRTAGINQFQFRHGTHIFRHSLATNLMGLNEPIPVISEILGHSSTDTTMEYLRVSVPMLRKCSLDVPLVPSSFYGNLYAEATD